MSFFTVRCKSLFRHNMSCKKGINHNLRCFEEFTYFIKHFSWPKHPCWRFACFVFMYMYVSGYVLMGTVRAACIVYTHAVHITTQMLTM